MNNSPADRLHIVWIRNDILSQALDAATWLRTVEYLRDYGHFVTLIAADPGRRQMIRGVEVLCFPRPEVYLLRQVLFHLQVLIFILKEFTKIDLIIFHETSAPWFLPLKLVRFLTGKKRPLLVMDTRTLPMPHPEKLTLKDKMREKSYRLTSQMGSRFADGRLAITQRMADAVHIPAIKLWGIWPSGADMDHFSATRSGRIWPNSGEFIHLIYHGSLHYERNLMVLCRAVARAVDAGMLFKLSLVGDGTERKDLEAFSEQTNDIVHVGQSVPYEEIPEILSQAHVGILPFPDEEKFRVCSPIKLFEYMAAGLPILVTRVVCHTDVVGDGDFSFWAEDASEQSLLDGLKKVWLSRDLLSEMGQHASIAAEAWTWKASAEKLRKALENGYKNSISVAERTK